VKPEAVIRHGKPSNSYRASLRNPSTKDFDMLVKAAMSAIISDEVDVLISFAYTLRFPDTFPRGICISKEPDGSNVHRVKAKRLLMWLHENGYTDATVEMLGIQKRAFTDMEKDFK
jgi:hypothetical protein